MPRRLRFIPPEGSVVEVTTRTLQGRLLLRPSPELNTIIMGVLGRAQRIYRVPIHDCIFMSNHYHLLLSVTSALQLARFMGYFNGNLAKEVARLTGWKEKVWSRRYQGVLVSNEEAAQIARQRYILAHGAKENLVASPRDWPGVSSVAAHLDDARLEGLWFDRTQEFAARKRGVELSLDERTDAERIVLTPMPCWQHHAEADRKAVLNEMVRDIETEAAQRRIETGTPPTRRPGRARAASHGEAAAIEALARSPGALRLAERTPAPLASLWLVSRCVSRREGEAPRNGKGDLPRRRLPATGSLRRGALRTGLEVRTTAARRASFLEADRQSHVMR